MRHIMVGLALLGSSSALATPAQLAATYLQGQQSFDGSFGGATGTQPVYTTAVAMQALVPILGSSSTTVETARAFLSGRHPAEVDLQARRLQCLDGTLLADSFTAAIFRSAVQSAAGFGFLGSDSAPTLLESAQAIAFLAGDALLAAASQPPPIAFLPAPGCSQTSVICASISPMLQLILAAQDSDGGWAYSNESSDLRLTAEIAAVLMPLRHELSIDTQLTAAVNFLLAQQGADGHFGSASPSTADTAMAMVALVGAPTTQATAVNKGVTFLTGSQKADGSWDESELDTALGAWALEAALATLQVNQAAQGTSGSLTLSSNQTSTDGTVTASLIVTNSGDSASAATTVVFTAVGEDGQPSVVLGSAPVGAINAGSSSTVNDTLSTSGLAGPYEIVATVESGGADQSLVSAAEATADAQITVVSPYDLALTTNDIQFSILDAGGVLDAGIITITATVHENGALEAHPFNMGFYEGNPAAEGTLIGESAISWIDAGASASASLNWILKQGNGLTPIFVVADPEQVIPDNNRANNTASAVYQAPVTSVDLAVLPSGITFSPAVATPGQPVTVNAAILNLSTTDQFNVEVGFCPAVSPIPGCPAQIVTLPVVPASSSASVSFVVPGSYTVLPPGTAEASFYVTVYVDPFGLLADPNIVNNTASSYVVDANDLSISLTSFVPTTLPRPPAVAGTSVAFQANVTSTSPTLEHVPWVLYVGDPDFGGVPIQSGNLEVLAQAILTFNAALTGPATLFVLALDPENTLNNDTPWLARASYTYSAIFTDLGIGFNDISFSPVGPSVGETSTVAVTVHNYGDAGASSELWAFEGDPGAPGALAVGEFPVAIAAAQTQQISFPWTRQSTPTLYFQLTDTVPNDLSATDDFAARNAYLEAVYSSGRVDSYGVAPFVSAPAVGDLLGTGQPVIAYGEALNLSGSWQGHLTLVQKSSANVLTTVWSKTVDSAVGAPIFVNVGGDAGPSIVFLSTVGQPGYNSFKNRGNTIHVWTPQGNAIWEKTYAWDPDGGPTDACMNENNLAAPAVGDVNGDGIADVVFPSADGTVHVLDGRNGNVIWETAFPSGDSCLSYGSFGQQPSVLDINGDGKNEVLISFAPIRGSYGNVLVYSSTGTLLSPATGVLFGGTNNSHGQFMVASLTGPGGLPAVIGMEPSDIMQAAVDGGVTVWRTQLSNSVDYGAAPAAADGMGDGRPLLFAGAQAGAVALDGRGNMAWMSTGSPAFASYSLTLGMNVAAADLLGLGRPQLLVADFLNGLDFMDGPSGARLFSAGATLSDYQNADEPNEVPSIAIADVDGDGHGEVVLTSFGDSTDTPLSSRMTGYNQQASLLIFGSDSHWKAMPNVWSGTAYHHQFNSNLTLSSDAYTPWTTHNTWREQFVTSATTLAPDLVVTANDGGENDVVWAPSPSDGGSAAAGASTNVTVTVHNLGGVAASSVPVTLYLGNPADGGLFLATQTISGTLDAGGGVGSTVFPWIAWPEGFDQLTAIANAPFPDGGRAIAESNYGNNQWSTTALVRAGTQLADLSVAGANFGTTLGYAAGQPVTLETTVSNLGSVNAGAFPVVFSDGPGGTGPVIGSQQISGLKAGASTVVSIANWLPAQGLHVVTVQADPARLIPDSNLSNNAAVITFIIGNATKPDLQITASDLTLSPGGTVEPGTTLELGCTLHNEGAPVGNVPLSVTLDPGKGDQTVLLSTTIAATLPTGIALPFTVPVPTASLAPGVHTLTATADPGGVIAEYNEANNSASISFMVGTAPASVIVSTNLSSYGASAPVTVTAALDGLTSAASIALVLEVEIESAAGDVVAPLASSWDLALGSGVTQTLPFAWNTGATAPGSYLAFASLTDATTGITVSTSQAAFTISATVSDGVSVAPLLNGYQPGATAVVATQITDQSLNASIANATLQLQINTPGALSFYSSTREFLSIGTGQDQRFLDSVAIPYAAAPGNYPITATVKSATGTTLATASGTLVVQSPTVSNEFQAGLSATPPAVAIGTNVALAASLTNQSGVILNNQTVNVEVAVPATQVVIANFPSNQSFAIGQHININNNWSTVGVAAGSYLAAVLVNGTAVAHAVIQVDVAGGVPPLITVTGVSDGELTNQTVTPVISINAPSGAFNSTTTLNGSPFASGTPVAGPGTYFLAVSATDVNNNTSSVSVAFTIYTTAPRITVGGVSNGEYTNAASVAPTVAIADPYLDPTKTVEQLNGAAFYQGLQVTAEGSYVLSISAQDKAGNSALSNVDFVIDRTKPVITITGVTSGEVTNAASVAATITVTDANLQTSATSIKLNGAAYTSGTAITAEASYTLVVSAADLAGNTASQTIGFAIDRTAPTITITGVTNGHTYAGAVQPTITVADAHPKTSSATLDGSAYTSGTTITASGSHTLAVTATDQAGNNSSVSDTFTISPPSAPPFFNPGLCASSVALSNGAFVAPLTDAGLPILLNSSGAFSAANTSLVVGSAIAAGNLSFSGTADLTGTVLLGGTETLTGQAALGAVVQEAAGFTSPCCTFNLASALTAASTNNDNAQLPSAITSLVVDGGFTLLHGSVSFPAGDFYFLSFEVGDGGSVGLSAGAVTQLYVNGPLSVQGTFSGDATRLNSLTVLASGNVSLSAGQSGTSQGGVTIIGEYPVAGLFYSSSTVSLSGSTELIGGVVANTLNLSGSASALVPLSLTPADAGMVCQ